MEYRNAKFVSEMAIDCEINHPIYGWIPYTLNPEDTDNTVDNVALRASMGSDIAEYIPLTPEEVEVLLATEARSNRNLLLSATDWTGSSDITMSEEMITYRQSLRDVPSQTGFPHTIIWHTKP